MEGTGAEVGRVKLPPVCQGVTLPPLIDAGKAGAVYSAAPPDAGL